MSVLIVGDIHLGKCGTFSKVGVGSSLNSRTADQLDTLDWIIERAIEHCSSNIVVTGDVFEEPKPSPSIITYFVTWLKKCEAYGIHVNLIIGNHDILRTGFFYTSPLDIINECELSNVTIHNTISTVIIGSVGFTMVPFRDRKSYGTMSNASAMELLKSSFVYELAGIPLNYSKVVIGHLAIEGSIPVGDEIDDLANELFCPVDLFIGYDYVWMGHVHKPQIMNQKSPYVAHIGSMDISNFGETSHKKIIIIVDTFGKEKFITEEVPNRELRQINIVVPKNTEDSTAYVLEQIEELKKLDKSIVRIDISLESPELKSINKGAIEKLLLEKGASNVAGISESKKMNIIKKDKENSINTQMSVQSTINTYALVHVSEEIRNSFIEVSLEILQDLKAEAKD